MPKHDDAHDDHDVHDDLPAVRVTVTVGDKLVFDMSYCVGESMAERVEQALCDLENREGELIEKSAIAAYGGRAQLRDAPALPCRSC